MSLRRLLILLEVLALLLGTKSGWASVPPVTGRQPTKVVVQLRWDHQFQFAGFYAADWQGFYADEGLEVELRPGIGGDGKLVSAIDEVAAGRAQFGVAGADLLLARDRGVPVVVLASFFQHSATGWYSRSDTPLVGPADLVGLRVMRNEGDLIDVELQAVLAAEGIPIESIIGIPVPPGGRQMDDLLAGRADVIGGYSISADYVARQLGVDLNDFYPATYGIDFYGDSLFTSQDVLDGQSDVVERFTRATVRGWQHALEHPEEVADRIAAELPRQSPVEDVVGFNRFQAAKVGQLMLYPTVDPGHINPHRWRHMHELLADLGMVSGPFDEAGFIYGPERQVAERSRRFATMAGWALLVFILVATLAWIVTMRRALRLRTASLAERSSQLERVNVQLLEREREIRRAAEQARESEQAARASEETARQAAETAAAANAAKDRFLAMLSHELRTPLTPVRMAAEMLSDGHGHDNAELADIARLIRRNIDLETSLIDDLLDLTRIARGKLHLDKRLIDLHEVVDGAVDICAGDAEEAGLELVVDKRASHSTTLADRSRMHQVLWNLLKNAIKFTPRGGRIRVETEADAGEIEVRVIDTGTGLPAEALARVFEPFEQGSSSRDHSHETGIKTGGFGLGLAICRGVVEAHGGSIAVASAGEGRGARFSFRLPLMSAQAGDEAAPTTASPASLAGLKLLLVEDHADTRRAMTTLLNREGLKVTPAASQAEALEILATAGEALDVLVSDLGLPDGSGLKLAQPARAAGVRFAVAVSGWGAEADRAASASVGFDAHLVKPLEVSRLLEELCRLRGGNAPPSAAGT